MDTNWKKEFATLYTKVEENYYLKEFPKLIKNSTHLNFIIYFCINFHLTTILPKPVT